MSSGKVPNVKDRRVNVPVTDKTIKAVNSSDNAVKVWRVLDAHYHLGTVVGTSLEMKANIWRVFLGLC